ncbi:MAG TPA: methyltransferase domain-containing protein [Casimicrobiaceae bacterium]|nr:methyltransferase domain-containing protein [Casimicrobiaceae bacterium]
MDLRYEPLERLHVPRPVDRLSYVADACRGRAVLDLGALDETAWTSKRGHGTWLHERIAAVAGRVLGVDSSTAVPDAGLATGPRATIVRGDIADLDALLGVHDFRPDVVVAGELIEHVPSPLAFLQALVASPRLAGCELVLTTPNATAVHNVIVGLASRESTHRDHLCILSYKTLSTLCARAGLQRWTLVPYRSAFVEMRARNPGLRGALVGAAERAVNAVEWLFPLLAFGWIVRATL